MGKMYSYAEFYYVIEGNEHYMSLAFDQHFLYANNLYFNNRNYDFKAVVYREYSATPIEGNDDIVQKINNNAVAKRVVIEQKLDAFNIEAEAANKDLKQFIDKIVDSEKEKRILKKAAFDKLNPF